MAAFSNSDAERRKTLARPKEAESPERRRQHRFPVKSQVVLYWWKDGTHFQQDPVELFDASEDGLGLFLFRTLPVGLMVWIQQGEELIRGVVRHCTEQPNGYLVGVLKIVQERRRYERELVREPGTLFWGKASSPVILRNVTDEGMQLEVPEQVPVPSFVRLTFDNWECLATTVYCEKGESSYLVGLYLTRPPYPPNTNEYKN